LEENAFTRSLKQAPAGGAVLDVACGTGRYTGLLLGHGYKVGGIDISKEILFYASAHNKENSNLLFLSTGDAEHLPFEDNQFDGVTCMRLLHRIPPNLRVNILKELNRVTREWAIVFFGMSSPWITLRQTSRSKIIRGRPSNP